MESTGKGSSKRKEKSMARMEHRQKGIKQKAIPGKQEEM